MFLALREIRHSASRFILITTVIFLVSYLVYFLTGLAYGLASSYSEIVKNWQANSLIMSEAANYNITGSRITNAQADTISAETNKAIPVSVSPVVITLPKSSDQTETAKTERKNAFIFGIDLQSEITPELVEGNLPSNEYQILVDIDFQKRGFQLGDTVKLPVPQATDETEVDWEITGFVKEKFTAAPTVFVDFNSYQEHLLPVQNPQIEEKDRLAANAILLFEDPNQTLRTFVKDAELEIVSPDEFINNLPGYRAQVLTFALMIGSLIGITALVLSIFIYVLTVQKRQIFGIMKAQGISTAYIIRGGAAQTFTLASLGVGLGFGAVVLTSLAIGNNVPFKIEPTLYATVTAGFIIFIVMGGLIPTRMISRIDPIEAIN